MSMKKEYQEKIEKLEAEMKEHNLAIAHRIERFLEDAQSEIVDMAGRQFIQIDGKINRSDCAILGSIDHLDIVHLIVRNTTRYNNEDCYSRRLSENSLMRIEGDFSLVIEHTINAHESELEQEFKKVLKELSHYHE